MIARLGQALVRARAVPLAAYPSKLPLITPKQALRVGLQVLSLAVNVAAAAGLAVLAVIGPYGVLVRIFWGFAACGAAVGVVVSFVKLREALRGGEIAEPS
jgi:hypothetical protein